MLETLASGYGLLEGPRVDAADNLYFSDVPNGGVYCRCNVGLCAGDGSEDTEMDARHG